jgi:integration host factor subunit alpha
MTLTKEKIIRDIYDYVGLSKTKSRSVVERLFEEIKSNLEKGDDILISGFGKLSVKQKKERRGRNPQTSEDLILKPRKVVVFKASGVLREKINS